MGLSERISNFVKLNVAKRKLKSRDIDSSKGNPLEMWGLLKIKKEIAANEELSYLGKDNDLKREDIKEYKLYKFKQLLDYVSKNSPYYQELFEKEGIKSTNIKSMSDISKVPLTTHEQLIQNPYHFLCVSRREIAREFTTSGTTTTETANLKKRISYTQDELLDIVDSVISGLKMAGMDSEKDMLQIMYPTLTATWDPGLVLSKACDLAGFKSVINDSSDINDQINTMVNSGTTFIIGKSSFIYDLSKSATNLDKLRSLGIKNIICSSEPLTEEMKEVIEDAWGCTAVRQWGMTELGLANAIECTEQNGMHVNNPDFLVEVIDPDTGQVLPEGSEGELVFTTLNRRCMPLVRYRTKDLGVLLDEPCGCGTTLDQRIKNVRRMEN
ncbi:phenylacetate--CoA ligase family protein [Methanosalsum natronophilum]|uniref:Phenylacetate--CoA ligase family protein n=1 Tax=Methanosalsum natronophilum TaxID=768733 RepID=A0A3R7VU86_9EURY|nr:MAG: phenylacetate--CoA ligase family protein [Methanosalsum natronophilum]